jgi:hypothetical protein
MLHNRRDRELLLFHLRLNHRIDNCEFERGIQLFPIDIECGGSGHPGILALLFLRCDPSQVFVRIQICLEAREI